MAQLLPLATIGHTVDAETAALLSTVYDKALNCLHDTGQPPTVLDVIVKRIVAVAAKGERDPDRLCEAALAALGVPH